MRSISLSLALCVGLLVVCTEGQEAPAGQYVHLQAELECLTEAPKDQCDLEVVFAAPVGNLSCNGVVPANDVYGMFTEPQLSAPTLNDTVKEVLIFMFDPDADFGEGPATGFVHWVAQALVEENKDLTIEVPLLEYIEPNPSPEDEAHRYQIFVFDFAGYPEDLVEATTRSDELCLFMEDNSLGQPLASFEFKYSSKEE